MKTNKVINYFILYLLIAVTGMVYYTKFKQFIVLGFLLSLIIFIIKKEKFDKYFFTLLLIITFVHLGQFIFTKLFTLQTYIGLYIRIGFAYFVIKILKEKFFSYYVNILFFFSIISLIIWTLCFIPGLPEYCINNLCIPPLFHYETNYLYSIGPNIIIYNFGSFDEVDYFIGFLNRNCGPFWEGGAFGGFLVLAIIFNTITEAKFLNKKNIIFIISLISTFSVTAYIALLILILGKLLYEKKKYILLLPIALSVSLYLFFNLNFMKNKIENDINTEAESGRVASRSLSAQLDFQTFLKNPIFGIGRNEAAEFDDLNDLETMHRNNGLSLFLKDYGIFIFFFYFYFIYRGLKAYCIINNFDVKFSLVAIFCIILIGYSETYYMRNYFIALPIYFFFLKNNLFYKQVALEKLK
ncbi:MAG: hypothetical protein WC223_09970 [Bacteroidales bacterium]|jgi:hypothetical protein